LVPALFEGCLRGSTESKTVVNLMRPKPDSEEYDDTDVGSLITARGLEFLSFRVSPFSPLLVSGAALPLLTQLSWGDFLVAALKADVRVGGSVLLFDFVVVGVRSLFASVPGRFSTRIAK
jgi:hypothetical protein